MTTPITNKLTFDTDPGRSNSHPSTIKLSTGQTLIFYTKKLKTGKLSNSQVRHKGELNLEVEGGNGEVNGSTITWNQCSLVAKANSNQVIYVTTNGVVHIEDYVTMAIAKDSILLANISTGSSIVVHVEEFESTGNYIFLRKQVFNGIHWVWDDLEYILNAGINPQVNYNSETEEIFLSYLKNDLSYLRKFELNTECTWEYLSERKNINNDITIEKTIGNKSIEAIATASKTYSDLDSDIYPIGPTNFCFKQGNIYVLLPAIGGEFLDKVSGEVTYEFLIKNNNVYTVEATYTLSNIRAQGDRYVLWGGTLGDKYLRISLNTELYNSIFITAEEDYRQVFLWSGLEHTLLETTLIKDNAITGVQSSAKMAYYNKVSEYKSKSNFQNDTMEPGVLSSGYEAALESIDYRDISIISTDRYDSLPKEKEVISSGYTCFMSIISI